MMEYLSRFDEVTAVIIVRNQCLDCIISWAVRVGEFTRTMLLLNTKHAQLKVINQSKLSIKCDWNLIAVDVYTGHFITSTPICSTAGAAAG